MAETKCVNGKEAHLSGPIHSISHQAGIYRIEFEGGGALVLNADELCDILAKHFAPEKPVHHDSGGS